MHEEFGFPSIQTEIFDETGFQRLKQTLPGNIEGKCNGHLDASEFMAILGPKKQISAIPEKISERFSGSGYALNAYGQIVTNYHVVEGCHSLSVRQDARTARADLVASINETI